MRRLNEHAQAITVLLLDQLHGQPHFPAIRQVGDCLFQHVTLRRHEKHATAGSYVPFNQIGERLDPLGRRRPAPRGHLPRVGRNVDHQHVILLDPRPGYVGEALRAIDLESLSMEFRGIGQVEPSMAGTFRRTEQHRWFLLSSRGQGRAEQQARRSDDLHPVSHGKSPDSSVPDLAYWIRGIRIDWPANSRAFSSGS